MTDCFPNEVCVIPSDKQQALQDHLDNGWDVDAQKTIFIGGGVHLVRATIVSTSTHHK